MPLYQQGGLLSKKTDLNPLGQSISEAMKNYLNYRNQSFANRLAEQQFDLQRALQEAELARPQQEQDALN